MESPAPYGKQSKEIEQLQGFFDALFGAAINKAQQLCIFSLPSARTRHFETSAKAAKYALSVIDDSVYFGMGLAGKNFNRGRKAADIVGLHGFWADIDLAESWRTAKSLPETMEEAKKILDGARFNPTLLVDSGHGLHAYWVFQEPWIFANEAEHKEASTMAAAWVANLQVAGLKLGYAVDSVGDLSRVLRVPGTINKGQLGADPVEVKILQQKDELRIPLQSFRELFNPPEPIPPENIVELRPSLARSGGMLPGDDFNARGDWASILIAHGWKLLKDGENQEWQRPGKMDSGKSATFNGLCFYVFSSSAEPFEANKGYSKFSAYALLEHGGDFSAAASALRAKGYGDNGSDPQTDISGILNQGTPAAEPAQPEEVFQLEPLDPGPTPMELLRCPGFISEVMDYCLETAPYPSQVLAFCGALTLQAFLAGRKIRDKGDNRTNLYVLGLAHSAVGKDWARRLNIAIARSIGCDSAIAITFASGEGLQDALFRNPCTLFQMDEADSLMRQVNGAKDAKFESIINQLLMLYSSAATSMPLRKLAKREELRIEQPCMILFGTAIPNFYYEALSHRMLSNGLFARTLLFEAGPRPTGQDAKILEIPERILETAKWWAEYQPGGGGNLSAVYPTPATVEYSQEAREFLRGARLLAEAEYSKAEAVNDLAGTSIWGRCDEQTRKLALIYAISARHDCPEIDLEACQWAQLLVRHQICRMLFMASAHVADNPHDALCLKVLRMIRAAGGSMGHSRALKNSHLQTKVFLEVAATLEGRKEIFISIVQDGGRNERIYHLVRR